MFESNTNGMIVRSKSWFLKSKLCMFSVHGVVVLSEPRSFKGFKETLEMTEGKHAMQV